jgi:hypothetical protein
MRLCLSLVSKISAARYRVRGTHLTARNAKWPFCTLYTKTNILNSEGGLWRFVVANLTKTGFPLLGWDYGHCNCKPKTGPRSQLGIKTIPAVTCAINISAMAMATVQHSKDFLLLLARTVCNGHLQVAGSALLLTWHLVQHRYCIVNSTVP